MINSGIQETVEAWAPLVAEISDWRALVDGIIPKPTGCGPIYELENFLHRGDESFAIADMRNLKVTEPHYHPNGETEIYIVLTGLGRVVVGGEEQDVEEGSVIITPPDTAHFTIPKIDLVLAVINTPSFNPANYKPLSASDTKVKFDQEQFLRLSS